MNDRPFRGEWTETAKRFERVAAGLPAYDPEPVQLPPRPKSAFEQRLDRGSLTRARFAGLAPGENKTHAEVMLELGIPSTLRLEVCGVIRHLQRGAAIRRLPEKRLCQATGRMQWTYEWVSHPSRPDVPRQSNERAVAAVPENAPKPAASRTAPEAASPTTPVADLLPQEEVRARLLDVLRQLPYASAAEMARGARLPEAAAAEVEAMAEEGLVDIFDVRPHGRRGRRSGPFYVRRATTQ